jgi:hypothetical protein
MTAAEQLDTWTSPCEDMNLGEEPWKHPQVQWCAAWDLWLCDADRLKRGNADLNRTPSPARKTLPAETRLML